MKNSINLSVIKSANCHFPGMSSVINTAPANHAKAGAPIEMAFSLTFDLSSPSQAYMRRFPKCPLIPVFVDSEVISETLNEDGSVSVTERRCTIDIDAPRLLKRVCSSMSIYDLVCLSLEGVRYKKLEQTQAGLHLFTSNRRVGSYFSHVAMP